VRDHGQEQRVAVAEEMAAEKEDGGWEEHRVERLAEHADTPLFSESV
jgi:hypothetical protein